MFNDYEDLMTALEAAAALRIGKNALYELLGSGKLKGYRNGRVWRVPRKAVEEYIFTASGLTR